MKNVVIKTEHVELFKLLKFENLTSSGGEAKRAISEGLVTVNGVTELRKRKKLIVGDIVKFDGEEFKLFPSK